jgi:hypothetical protein
MQCAWITDSHCGSQHGSLLITKVPFAWGSFEGGVDHENQRACLRRREVRKVYNIPTAATGGAGLWVAVFSIMGPGMAVGILLT